jgi:type I restriction enzyme S subunit
MNHSKKKLKDVARYYTGKKDKSSITTLQYISTTNMIPDKRGIKEAVELPPSNIVNGFEPQDILIANIRPYFKKIWFSDRVGGCDADILNIRANKDIICPEYLFYTLFKDDFFDYIMVGAKGVKMPRGDKNFIMNYSLVVPSMDEQIQTIERIRPIFSHIENNYRIIEGLEEYVQLLYHKWFVDFNFPNENGKPYRESGGEMTEVNGKLIPKGWDVVTINELADKITETIDTSNTPDKIYNYYNIPTYDKTKLHDRTPGELIGSNKYVVTNNNLLVSKLNPWFKRVVYPYKIDEAVASTEFVVLEPKVENVREYLFVILTSNNFINYCVRAATGTSNSHKRVSPDHMLKYSLTYQINKVEEFNHLVNPMINKLSNLLIENQLLEQARDVLIKKLIK